MLWPMFPHNFCTLPLISWYHANIVSFLNIIRARTIYDRTSTYAFFWFFVVLFFLWDRVSVCSLDCPGTLSVVQACLRLRDPSASASQVLGLKECTINAWPQARFICLFKVNIWYGSPQFTRDPRNVIFGCIRGKKWTGQLPVFIHSFYFNSSLEIPVLNFWTEFIQDGV